MYIFYEWIFFSLCPFVICFCYYIRNGVTRWCLWMCVFVLHSKVNSSIYLCPHKIKCKYAIDNRRLCTVTVHTRRFVMAIYIVFVCLLCRFCKCVLNVRIDRTKKKCKVVMNCKCGGTNTANTPTQWSKYEKKKNLFEIYRIETCLRDYL